VPPAEPAPAPAPWHLYQADGRIAQVDAVVRQTADVDVIFVGELHGNQGTHHFQLELLEALIRDAARNDRELVLSLEMFERDVQLVLDEYLAGLITEEQFLAAARPWPNYRRDYRPLVEAAREEGLRVIAANAPRRYANRVSRLGVEALSDLPPEAERYLPPLPFPAASQAYREEWFERMEALAQGHGHQHGMPEFDEDMFQAQALWDAAMAHAIHQALEGDGPGAGRGVEDESSPRGDVASPLVLHLTGSFHVENRTGTPEALRHYRPDVRDLVVTSRATGEPGDLARAMEDVDPEILADFILLTPRSSSGER